jgi:hypothetical protein
MSKPAKPPENIGTVPVNSGLSSNGKAYGGTVTGGKFTPHASAALVREQDPAGAIVVHAVRRSAYVHERLHSLTTLSISPISTSSANDMLIAFVRVTGTFGTITRPSGLGQIVATGGAGDAAFEVVSSTLSGTTQTYSWTAAGSPAVMFFDAIQSAGGAITKSNLLLNSD